MVRLGGNPNPKLPDTVRAFNRRVGRKNLLRNGGRFVISPGEGRFPEDIIYYD
jgi:hypothetical protein